MSNNNSNFAYLQFNITPNKPATYSTNVANRRVMNQVRSGIKKFETVSGTDIYKPFKELLTKHLVNDVERPFIDYIKMIKAQRPEDEYLVVIRKVYESIKKERESAERSIIGIKKYLDYMEGMRKNSTKPFIYLPGLESERKLAPIELPDMLGFTKSPQAAEKYNDLIMLMSQSFLGFGGGQTLTSSLRNVRDYLDNKSFTPEEMSILNINLDRNIASNPPLKKIRAYYFLIKSLTTGKFDINQFLNNKEDVKPQQENPQKFGNKKDFRRTPGGKFKGKKKGKQGKQGKQGEQRNKGQGVSKINEMINFVLGKENFKINGNKNREYLRVAYEFNIALKTGGINFFKYIVKEKIGVDFDTENSDPKRCFEAIKSKNTTNALASCKGVILGGIENLLSIGFFADNYENNLDKDKIKLRDFYNGNDVVQSIKKTPKGNDISEKQILGFYAFYQGYSAYYNAYKPDDVIEPPTATESLNDSFRIVNGIGIYLTILFDLLTKLEVMMLQYEVKLQTSVQAEQSLRRMEEERQKKVLNTKLLEYREFLRELDEKLLKLKNSKDPNKDAKIRKLLELRDKVMKEH